MSTESTTGIIYKTTNLINDRIYIGKSIKLDENYLGSGIKIKYAIKKYGTSAFKREIIDYAQSLSELNEKEIHWIESLSAQDKNVGYNISDGGGSGTSGLKKIHNCDLNKEKCVKEENVEKWLSDGWKRGTLPRTDKWRKEHSDKMKGRKFSEEHKNKISKALKGRKFSEESRMKNSLSHRGKNATKRQPVICLETGRKFYTIKDAADWAGCTEHFIIYSAKHSVPKKGYTWDYIVKEV